MPALGAAAHEEGGGSRDITDGALVDELTAGLNARAQEGVGGTADHEAALLGQLHQLHALLPGSTQGLLGVDVLPRQQGRLGDVVVLVGAGEIQNDIHLGVCEQLVHILVELGDMILPDGILGPLADEVADTDDLDVLVQVGDILQIDAGDTTDTDDTDLFHGDFSLSVCVFRGQEALNLGLSLCAKPKRSTPQAAREVRQSRVKCSRWSREVCPFGARIGKKPYGFLI